MNLTEDLRARIEAWIRDELAKFVILSEYDLFFFGSRTTTTEPSTSDIDIGIKKKTGGSLPPGALSHMQEYVRELPILYKIDFVDFGTVSEAFAETASKTMEPFRL